MVSASDLARARMELASADLPSEPAQGYELLDKDRGLGVSREAEAVRHRRALEGELAQTISSIDGVDQARVHLALPDASAFLRDQQQPSASVAAQLGSAGSVSDKYVEGIVNLVANSVPQLEPEHVSVVDEEGTLLSDNGENSAVEDVGRYQQLTRQLESEYVDRIRDILAPLVGSDGVRAQVDANMDYTRSEVTSEEYSPDDTALRSEQIEREGEQGDIAQGVPGALANQPPGEAQAQPPGEGGNQEAGGNGDNAGTSRENITRNYEVDRRLEHSQPVPGELQRLSVAVVVDNPAAGGDAGGEGGNEQAPLSDEQLERARSLVRQAVGFNAERGDTLTLTGEAFNRNEQPMGEPADTPFWEDPSLRSWVSDLLVGLGLIALVLFVLRPTLKGLAARGQSDTEALPNDSQSASTMLPGSAEAAPAALANEKPYEQRLSEARGLAQQDPQRTARIAQEWLDGGSS